MPPRLPAAPPVRAGLSSFASPSSLSPFSSLLSAEPLLPSSTTLSVISCPHRRPAGVAAVASFSSTPSSQSGMRRRRMRHWFKTNGADFLPRKARDELAADAGKNSEGAGAEPATGEDQPPSYVESPFPLNPAFRSQAVLSEGARERIWERVIRDGQSVKAVSAEMGVDIRRVAAVVRLKEIEKAWESEGKPLARPYAKAVLSMLPQTPYRQGEALQPHEPVNDLYVHGYTLQQLFVPTSESRHFTREDAAKAFHTTLLSADKRVPIPELVSMEREVIRDNVRPALAFERFRAEVNAQERALVQQDRDKAAEEEERTTRVATGRFEFRIRDINVDDAGRDGRARKGVGWRYGFPFPDRKRGHVKIPTSAGM